LLAMPSLPVSLDERPNFMTKRADWNMWAVKSDPQQGCISFGANNFTVAMKAAASIGR
jgi:hypothetical protein